VTEAIKDEIRRLKKLKSAIIVAHNYERPEVQDIADYLGDSLDLSQGAAKTEAKVVVFCGVRFMAETAAILSPAKTVLLPAPEAGCPLADMATAEQVRQKRVEYPDAAVVSYVNTSAAVKAESDICCTSANAVEIVRSVNKNRRVLFVPDRNLGRYAGEQADREMILWDGWCSTHISLSLEDVARCREQHPRAAVMAHPECSPEVLEVVDTVAGTSGMITYAGESDRKECIVGTESGMVYRLQNAYPEQVFYPATEHFICPTMKVITLRKIHAALQTMRYVVRVPESVQRKARRALDAMLAVQA
jgi:quinolinate synthase